MKAPRIFFWFWLIFGVASSSFAATRVFTDADNGKSIQLKRGDRIELRLESNPTTGCEWSVLPQSTPLLKASGQSQTTPESSGVGRPIQQIFRFQAVTAGDGVLLLHYVRSWEKPSADEQQFKLKVTIQ